MAEMEPDLFEIDRSRSPTDDRQRAREAGLIRLLLACVATIGVILVFRVPPMGGFDEAFHWRRALQIAGLHPLAVRLGPNDWGGRLDARALALEDSADRAISTGQPISIPDFSALSARLSRLPPSTAVSSFPSTASFSPAAYLPAALGIAAARSLRLGLLSQFHAGRLANLMAYLLLCWSVARMLPVGGPAALVLLTGPTALHLAASFSADPISNAVPALLTACCLRLRAAPDRLPPRFWTVPLLLAVLVGLLKATSLVFSALVLLVPARLFPTPGRAWAFRAASMAGCLAATLAWNLAYPFVPGVYWHTGAVPRIAVQALLRAPLHGVRVLLQNGWDDRWFWWIDGWGRYGGGPGPYHFTVPALLPTAFLVALLALAVCDRAMARAWLPAAGLLALLAASCVALLLLAFRIGYGPPLSDFIDGVQGRYLLLPEYLLLLAIILAAPARLRAPHLVPALLALCVLLDLGAAVVALGHYAAIWH